MTKWIIEFEVESLTMIQIYALQDLLISIDENARIYSDKGEEL